jgi:hypothetical protein
MNDLKVTGYDPYEWFFATRYKQGGRTVYAIDFSVREIITFLPKPDPDKPLDTQRKIYPAHANGFAQYILSDEEWVSPALLLRGPAIFEFGIPDVLKNIATGSTQFGQMGIPKDAKTEIKIVDGQHRTLGFHIAWEHLGDKIEKARGLVQAAKKNGEAAAVIAALEKTLFSLLDRRSRFEKERVSVQIVVCEDPAEARRIFVDINDNAKGITGSVKARFDDRKVVTRALNSVLENNLFLKGKVDEQQDRIAGGSTYLLGAKHVADIIRALVVGHGRITPRLEDELVDSNLVKEFDRFLEAMVDAFPILSEYDDGDVTAAELRAESLVGSNVILRAFAAAWYFLRKDGMKADEIAKAFGAFGPHMGPVFPDPKDSWFATGVFPSNASGTTSPTSRAQDFKVLTTFIVEAAMGKMAWHRATAPA